MHSCKVTFKGSVLDLKVELEGEEVGLSFDGTDTWSRIINHLKIEGDLNVFMRCKGINKTPWEFQIDLDGKTLKKYSGIIAKGFSIVTNEISIN